MIGDKIPKSPDIAQMRKEGVLATLQFIRPNDTDINLPLRMEKIPRIFEQVYIIFSGDILFSFAILQNGWYQVRSVYSLDNGEKIIRLTHLPQKKSLCEEDGVRQCYVVPVLNDLPS